jgi:hypothetical protein
MTISGAAQAALFSCLLFVASVWDLRKREIPDTISALLFYAGLLSFTPDKLAGISSTDGEERAYQKYIADLKDWETLRNEIIGDSSKSGSLKYYENELDYIEQCLDALYSEKQSERKSLVSKIFEQKSCHRMFTKNYTSLLRES